jgi:hypothetical protein
MIINPVNLLMGNESENAPRVFYLKVVLTYKSA